MRQQAFTDVCAHIVNENVFSQFLYKSLGSSTHLWAFKKQLCAQTALSGRGGAEGGSVPGWRWADLAVVATTLGGLTLPLLQASFNN